jgi:hypothetical protein
MKEKKIRTILPFVIVFVCSYFLSDADLLHDFGNRFDFVEHNIKLIWLFIIGDVGQAIEWFCCSLIFFTAWIKNRNTNKWYSDLLWQFSGIFVCWSVSCALSFVSNFASFLWIQGLVRTMVFVFGFYFLNTLFAARKLIYYPETKEEMLLKAQKFEELLKKLNDV